ncbi:MAG: O-antigen ligase family protein [Chloracidobacterium sp.]|nr:O-antigen ligase family protein [Chloracidobacterium sp.]
MTRLNKFAFFLICTIVVFTTAAYGTVHQPTLVLFYVFVTALLILWAADSLTSGEVRFSRSVLQIPLFALAVYGFVQCIPLGTYAESAGISGIPRTISMEPFATQLTALHLLALGIFFSVTLVYLDSAQRLRRMVTFIIVFGFIYAFFAILQSVLSPTRIYGIYQSQFGVPFGSFVNRHNFAAFIEMAISIPLGLLFVGAVKRDKRLLYVIAVVLMGSALLLSLSRGGLVSLIAEIILLIILTTGSSGGKKIVLKVALSFSLIAAAVGGAIFVGGDTSLTRFAESAASQDITSNRIHIWNVTLKVIAANMPFGTGLGAYTQAYTAFDTLSGIEMVEQSHNDYLQIVSDAGLIGLLIGGLFLFWFFREGIRNSRRQNTFRRGVAVGAFAGCFAVLVHSLFDFVLHISALSVLFLTLLALLVASGRRFEDDIKEFDKPMSKRRRSASVTSIGGKKHEQVEQTA